VYIYTHAAACSRMRLVHYVVMQGLDVTRDWNASAHENARFVSSVHLRNMSHISLGCLSLLLHTCVDKALVPVNSGLIHMPVPSPVLNSKSPASIEYDPLLHVDTHTASVDGCIDNMLSVSARFPTTSNWVLLELARNEHINELGFLQLRPTVIHEDNLGANAIAENGNFKG
jgi:hypothetical protein